MEGWPATGERESFGCLERRRRVPRGMTQGQRFVACASGDLEEAPAGVRFRKGNVRLRTAATVIWAGNPMKRKRLLLRRERARPWQRRPEARDRPERGSHERHRLRPSHRAPQLRED